jgi:hypothetical protein
MNTIAKIVTRARSIDSSHVSALNVFPTLYATVTRSKLTSNFSQRYSLRQLFANATIASSRVAA